MRPQRRSRLQCARLQAGEAIVLSDYRKGVVTCAMIAAAVSAAGRPVVVDPKVPEARSLSGRDAADAESSRS